ncbi:MAG: ferric reductase-like transmembrane domain-containing protein [Thermoleophilaceae bacterium]
MKSTDPLDYGWWLASRAAGIVGFGLAALAVILGLAMATGMRLPRSLRGRAVHEQIALASLAAIALHGALLLGDRWLKPGLAGILVPFAGGYRPFYTGLGIIAAYVAAIVGLSFYVRRRFGVQRWRKLHRFAPLVYLLGVVHVLGAGSDASATWMRAIVLVSAWPIVSLLALRLLTPPTRPEPRSVEQQPATAPPPRAQPASEPALWARH